MISQHTLEFWPVLIWRVLMLIYHLLLVLPLAPVWGLAAPRLLTVGDGLATAAVHLSQLGLRPATWTVDSMWVPKEVVDELNEPFPNASLMASKGAWNIVAISSSDIDEIAREFAEAAVKSSTTSELVIAGVGEDGASFINAARDDVELLVISESELSVIESWLGDGAASAAPFVPSLRDRLGSVGESLGARRICVALGTDGAGVHGAALWCLGGTRPNGMRKPDPFFEFEGVDVSSLGDGALVDAEGSSEAFFAALLVALLVDKTAPRRALERACALGVYVSSSKSAVPLHDDAPAQLRALFRPDTAEEEPPGPAAYGGEAERRRAAREAMETADR